MLSIFSIKDIKHDSYANPFFCKSVPDAMRQIIMALDNPNSMLAKFPTDFVLYQSGAFNEDNGTLTSFDNPIMIVTLDELANRPRKTGGPHMPNLQGEKA